MFSTKNCWPRRSESACATRRAMTSVGPPAGNPTTTRTGRFGYPCAIDGATPVSSNMAARIPSKTGIVALSRNIFLWRLGEGTLQNKGNHGRFGLAAARLIGPGPVATEVIWVSRERKYFYKRG